MNNNDHFKELAILLLQQKKFDELLKLYNEVMSVGNRELGTDILKLIIKALKENSTNELTSAEEVSGTPIRFRKDNNYGFIDTKGKIIIQPIYNEADDFNEEGFARVQIHNKYCMINKKGNIVTSMYDHIEKFVGGSAVACINGKSCLIDGKGNMITPMYENIISFSDGIAPVKLNGKWGFIDREGALVSQPIYDDADFLFYGLAAVKIGNKWGYVNARGKLVIQPIYDEAGRFNKSPANVEQPTLARVKINGKFGYINTDGDFVIEPIYDWAEDIFDHCGYAKVIYRHQEYYIDCSGKRCWYTRD